MLPALVTLTGKVWLTPCDQLVGTLLMSNVADQTAVCDVTLMSAGAHCCGDAVTASNQNWCSLIISASSTVEPAGALNVKLTVVLAPGATSPPSASAWLVSQCDELAEPPAELAK